MFSQVIPDQGLRCCRSTEWIKWWSIIQTPVATVARLIRIALVNTYLQVREVLIPSCEYPAHHLWGADHLPSESFEVIIIPPSGSARINRFCRWLSRITRFCFGDLDQELEIWKRWQKMDIAYVASRNMFFLLLLRALGLFRPRIVRWVYAPPTAFSLVDTA